MTAQEPAMTEMRREPLHATAAGVVDDAQAQVRRVTEGLTDFDRRLRDFVQAQPLTALLGAVVAGYVVARVFRRI
jgi:hypothetical protein